MTKKKTKMASNEIKLLLCTANVGTLFENLDEMMKIYVDELFTKINSKEPDFVAIHLQELGGKHYKQTMQQIDTFFKYLLSHDAMNVYTRYLITLDSDFTDDLSFTSLGNIYLIHKNFSANDVEIYNFDENSFYKHITKQIYTGNLLGNEFINKERFEKGLCPQFVWSRKGFLHTKWRLRGNVINLVNIHLFHDQSNLTALSLSPSIYSVNRKNALKYTIQKIQEKCFIEDTHSSSFYFGDFNFRLDLGALIEKYTSKPTTSGVKSEDSSTKTFTDLNENDMFIIGEKKFKWNQSVKNEVENLRQFDKELLESESSLFEFNQNFPPTYPFMEDTVNVESYMQTRCPAWCDRIFYNDFFNQLISQQNLDIEYDMIGRNAGMGDHKPIYLAFKLKNENDTATGKKQKLSENSTESRTDCEPLDSKKYTFINRNLSDLENPLIDLHDNAWFTQTHPLNNLFKYTNYNIAYLNSTEQTSIATQSHLISLLQSDNMPEIFEQSDITLNYLLRTVSELVIQFHKNGSNTTSQLSSVNEDESPSKSNPVNICYKWNQNDKKNVNKAETCQCISTLNVDNLSRSYLVQFFLNSVNANFYKLKHLISCLNDQIIYLTNELKNKHENNINNTMTNNNILAFTIQDLKTPLDVSLKSLTILNEVYHFLNSTCVLNLFRQVVKKSNEEKKFSIYFNFYNNTNFDTNKQILKKQSVN